jgi:hypothetical protein
LVAGAYAWLTERPYEITLEGRIEATEVRYDFDRAWLPRALIHTRPPPRIRPRDVALRRAVEIAGASRNRPGFRQALLDLLAAYRDQGDDAFLFAYHSIEDVAREITGSADLGANDWTRRRSTRAA